MDCENLIELVRNKPFLYNAKHSDHKNRIANQNAWKMIANELGCQEEEAKKKWRYLRDQYIKKRRSFHEAKRSGIAGSDLSKVQSWPLFNHLSWLGETLDHQNSESNFADATNEALALFNLSGAPTSHHSITSFNQSVQMQEEHQHNDDTYIDAVKGSPHVMSTNTSPIVTSPILKSFAPTSKQSIAKSYKRKLYPLKKCSQFKRRQRLLELQETLVNAIEESSSNISKMVAKTCAEKSIFEAYGNVLHKRLEAMGKKKASMAFSKILTILDEMESD